MQLSMENSDDFLRKKYVIFFLLMIFLFFRLVELKTLHASQHPNIVNFYGAFYVDGILSFILVSNSFVQLLSPSKSHSQGIYG